MHLFQGTENHFWGFVRDSKKGKLVYHTHIYAQSGGQIIPDEDWNWRKNQYFHSNVCFIFSRLEQTLSLCSITKQLPSTQQCCRVCVCVSFRGDIFPPAARWRTFSSVQDFLRMLHPMIQRITEIYSYVCLFTLTMEFSSFYMESHTNTLYGTYCVFPLFSVIQTQIQRWMIPLNMAKV